MDKAQSDATPSFPDDCGGDVQEGTDGAEVGGVSKQSEEGGKEAGVQGRRPGSVAGVGWFLIIVTVMGWLFFVGLTVWIANDANVRLTNPWLFLGIPTVSSAVQVAIGVGILNGRQWARVGFLWLIPLSIVLGLLGWDGGDAPIGLFLKMAWFVVCAYLLTRPHVVSYFKPA